MPATRLRSATGEAAFLPASTSMADRLLARGFSQAAIDMAAAVEILPLLERLSKLEGEGAHRGHIELQVLRLRQMVTERTLLAALDVSSTLAVIGCEKERGNRVKARLQAQENRRTRQLTLAGILIGASTATVTGGLSLAGVAVGSNVAGIVGGVAEASAGAALLFGEETGDLRTTRNLLREVSEHPPVSELFPRTVWRYLTKRPSGDTNRRTPAEALAEQWRGGERPVQNEAALQPDRAALLLASGGAYAIEDLDRRDAMLNLLEARVALMSEDLRVLLIEVVERPIQGPSQTLQGYQYPFAR